MMEEERGAEAMPQLKHLAPEAESEKRRALVGLVVLVFFTLVSSIAIAIGVYAVLGLAEVRRVASVAEAKAEAADQAADDFADFREEWRTSRDNTVRSLKMIDDLLKNDKLRGEDGAAIEEER
jgi:hypothetical protein